MALRFYNTRSRQVDEFVPIEQGRVRMYNCGPTVYGRCHIGNLRAFLVADLVRRYLRWSGYEVLQVMNLTDVDDKTIRGAREQGIPLRQFTDRYAELFFQDLKALGCEPAEHYPRATEHIPQMLDIVSRLLERGLAYERGGSVWFRVDAFPGYGKLSHLSREELQVGARIDPEGTGKEGDSDFALWKGWTEADGDVVWDSPWGRGRPGWHLECSAMSAHYLGRPFDVHTGGHDLIFPHHENEIAQSEGAFGGEFARYWLHNGYLLVDGRKMSKSEGNVYTLAELEERGCTGNELRYFLLSSHYRAPFNFTFEALDAARSGVQRLHDLYRRLDEARATGDDPEVEALCACLSSDFRAAMDDDLNTSAGLGAMFAWVREMNRRELSPADAARAKAALEDIDRVLGVLRAPGGDEGEGFDEDVLALVQDREAARKARDWTRADRLRAEVLARGVEIVDTADGPRLRRTVTS